MGCGVEDTFGFKVTTMRYQYHMQRFDQCGSVIHVSVGCSFDPYNIVAPVISAKASLREDASELCKRS